MSPGDYSEGTPRILDYYYIQEECNIEHFLLRQTPKLFTSGRARCGESNFPTRQVVLAYIPKLLPCHLAFLQEENE